ncbi:MAG: hypothetical protein Tsb0020_48090 [Haliangiales bacterium]
MSHDARWSENRSLAELRADDLRAAGVVFRYRDHLYRTTGQHLSHGGMGTVFDMERLAAGGDASWPEPIVGKVFQSQYLNLIRSDDITRRDHQVTLRAMDIIAEIDHPHLLPVYISEPIADNHLLVSPRKADTLLELVARGALSQRGRIELLMQALEGLYALHERRVIHRDFTLRNILADQGRQCAYLFDFDLALHLDDAPGATYGSYYQGRVFGSPGFSVAPELVAENLADRALTPRLDIYAIGGALFRMFSDGNPHGSTDDMWGLLMRIGDGLVFRGVSHIDYPEAVPTVLRPVIERCLERDPGGRYGSVGLVLRELEGCLDELDDRRPKTGAFSNVQTMIHSSAPVPSDNLRNLRSLPGADPGTIQTSLPAEVLGPALARYGYRIERDLGQVRGRSIFLATPIPSLVASGQFPYANTYPKIVTAVDIGHADDPQATLDLWFSRFLPVLESVRQGLFTSLHKVLYDRDSGHLLLFSEFVDDPRFGIDMVGHSLSLVEAFGLGFLLIRQVCQLHEHGIAHNNVRAESLLFKGIEATSTVLPCMVGLVEPSLDPDAIAGDTRNLAALILSWVKPSSVESASPNVRRELEELRARLCEIAADPGASARGAAAAPQIDELVALIANGLSLVDHNFRVLREHRGHLEDYLLLQVSRGLYCRLWHPRAGDDDGASA